MILRFGKDDTVEQAEMVAFAAKTVGTPLTISVEPDDTRLDNGSASRNGAKVKKQTLQEFIADMPNYERIRTLTDQLPDDIYVAAAANNQYIATAAPVKDGRIELIHYIKEQSIANEYHRYGSQIEVPKVED